MLVASFALAGYAALKLVQQQAIMVVVWFVGAAVLHDLLLVPLYALVDRGLQGPRRRARGTGASALPPVPWLNFVRFPAVVSGILLLVFAPSILRLSDVYSDTTGLSSAGYLARWLAVTGVLFAVSAVLYALRLRRAGRAGS